MFYQQLANVYQHVFPATKKTDFINRLAPLQAQILDVGCGDGRMALGLAARGHRVDAIDLSDAMVDVANAVCANQPQIDVRRGNMLDVATTYGANRFDIVACTGNTLVHLLELPTINRALRAFEQVLRPNGQLIVQILNYDYVYDQAITQLPLIDNDYVTFERTYTLGEQRVVFDTRLKLKVEQREYRASTQLFPLRPKALLGALDQLGYAPIDVYSGYDFQPFDNGALPLIVVAQASANRR